MSPTVLRAHGFRFFFYSGDGGEPPHIHVERDGSVAKYWLDPVRLHYSAGFRRHELGQLLAEVLSNRNALMEAWYDYFSY